MNGYSSAPVCEIMLAVIFYQPTTSQLENSIRASKLFRHSCFVFNGPTESFGACGYLSQRADVTIISNSGNFGIARALNQSIEVFEKLADCDLLLTLDQDTELDPILLKSAKETYLALSKTSSPCFALASSLSDMKGSDNLSLSTNSAVGNLPAPTLVNAAATSGTFFTKQALSVVGNMREDFFIDCVDHEWCLRAESKRVPIWQLNWPKVRHNMGDSGIVILGRFFPLHTSPARHYYIVRNSVYVFIFSDGNFPTRLRILTSALVRIFPYIFVSTHPFRSIRLILRGLLHGVFRKLGPLE